MVEQRTKVRLFFFLCPDLDVEACTHLLLSQNRFQSNFEFERPPFESWPDAEQRMSMLRQLEPGGKKELVKACQAVIEAYDSGELCLLGPAHLSRYLPQLARLLEIKP